MLQWLRAAVVERDFSLADKLEMKNRVWLFWMWGCFFALHSRHTVTAERAPGRCASTGEMGATAP
jgi:hypothetical protein